MGGELAKQIRRAIDFVVQAFGLLNGPLMEPNLEQVIAAIVSFVQQRDSHVTKTKLLKLLYLFDVEYYRGRRRKFTGFDWIYFHLGPWASDYDKVLADMVAQGLLIERLSQDTDYEARFYKTPKPIDVFKIFPDPADKSTLRIVLNAWADKTTSEILDYVYFH